MRALGLVLLMAAFPCAASSWFPLVVSDERAQVVDFGSFQRSTTTMELYEIPLTSWGSGYTSTTVEVDCAQRRLLSSAYTQWDSRHRVVHRTLVGTYLSAAQRNMNPMVLHSNGQHRLDAVLDYACGQQAVKGVFEGSFARMVSQARAKNVDDVFASAREERQAWLAR